MINMCFIILQNQFNIDDKMDKNLYKFILTLIQHISSDYMR